MSVDHRERAFEAAIEHTLLTNGGYIQTAREKFDRERAIDPAVFIDFVKETQPEPGERWRKLHGASTDSVLVDDLVKALDGANGALGVIRHGFKCFGKPVKVACFAPAHGMTRTRSGSIERIGLR